MLVINYFLKNDSIYMRVFVSACVGTFVFVFLFYKTYYLDLIYDLLPIHRVK